MMNFLIQKKELKDHIDKNHRITDSKLSVLAEVFIVALTVHQ
jgi:hypothetical protein